MSSTDRPSTSGVAAGLVEALRSAGCVFAEEEAALLSGAATSTEHLDAMLARRVSGEPLEQVIGWAEFHGLRIRLAPGVFVPRRRSEFLVSAALEHVREGDTLIDLCCGSGAIGAAIRSVWPGLALAATDVDPVAVACARANLPGAPVFCGDLYDALPLGLRGGVDVIVANAPYVPTRELGLLPREARDFEPSIALDGGADGVALQRRVLDGAASWLRSGGVVLVETSMRQAALTRAAADAAGLQAQVHTDVESETVVVAGFA